MNKMEFPGMLERFFKYVKIDTQSNDESTDFPSTQKQLNLSNLLKDDLIAMGLKDAEVTQWGYVLATLKTNQPQDKKVPTIVLIGHVDTSQDVSGENVNPQVHKNYDGNDVVLSSNGNYILKVSEHPYLKEQKGKTLITTDGSTLLGADNKAGITEIMAALEYLIKNPDCPRPNIRVLITPDEEVGRGTEHITVEEIKADYGYTIDGEKLGEIEDETFCADSVEIKINGVNVHPGYAKGKLVNAVKIAAEIIEQFPKDGMSPETTEKREGYIHPHHIAGGGEQVIIKVLIRDFEENGLKEKEAFIKNIIDASSAKYPKAAIEFKVSESYRNMKSILNQHPDVVEKAIKAVQMADLQAVKSLIRGGTDGARLCFMGIPTPNIFTGGSNFHSRYEWITLEDMQKASEVIVHLMKLWTD